MPTITRMQCMMVTAGLGLTFFACGDEDVRSDLNDDGPPRVITVTATSEGALLASADILEVATYCADPTVEKINANYCPTSADATVPEVTDTLPIGWELRVVFNELLSAASAEELINCIDGNHDGACLNLADETDIDDGNVYGSLINTQPVTVTCGGQTIPYDGYYQPAGNHLTIPPGPALIIQPMFPAGFAATGSNCEVTVKSEVQSKQLEPMSNGGPFGFQIAPMSIYLTDPDDGAVVAPDVQLAVLFNAYVDANSLSEITVTDAGGTVHPVVAAAFDDVVIVQSANGAFDPDTAYTMTINSGVSDIRGGTFSTPFQLSFTTTP